MTTARRHAPNADLRKLARGQPCMIRLPGCDGGGETTVLAHARLGGTCGMGMKPPDTNGAWGCNPCHALVDGRRGDDSLTREEIMIAFLHGVLRTLHALYGMGYRMVLA